MYIIVSCLLKTLEISHRSTYKTRVQARKSLQKEAQNWILQTKPGNEWEVVTGTIVPKTKYFIKMDENNEDIIYVFERIENISKGWVYNSTDISVNKLAQFSIVDICTEDDSSIETVRYVTVPVVEKSELTDSDRKILTSQRSLLKELKSELAERRLFIE